MAERSLATSSGLPPSRGSVRRDLSRIESGTLRLDVGLLDVRQAVGQAVALVESTAAAQGLAFEVHHGADVHTLRGDPTRVRQILVNLLSNAIKYNREGGWVAVRTRRHDDRVDIAVHDGGLGMGPDQVAQLFQPFNRLGREGSSVEGTGIGLVICQRLAQTMGGEIRVESRRDEGSTFTLVLPASDEVVVPPAEAAAGQGSGGGGGFERPLRVHYIEDDPVNREVVHAMLERYGELSLDCSATGAEALRKLRDGAEAPDLILLDLNLPDCDGARAGGRALGRCHARDPGQGQGGRGGRLHCEADPARRAAGRGSSLRHAASRPCGRIHLGAWTELIGLVPGPNRESGVLLAGTASAGKGGHVAARCGRGAREGRLAAGHVCFNRCRPKES